MGQKCCNKLSFITFVKKTIHFGLFAGFIFLSLLAIVDLFSYETDFRGSTRIQELTFPSFTLCLDLYYNKFELASGANPYSPSDILKQMKVTGQIYGGDKIWPLLDIDMTDSNQVKTNLDISFDEIWKPYCKSPYYLVDKNYCHPCITFNAPKVFKDGQKLTQVKLNCIF